MRTGVNIKRQVNKRLPYPYGDCIESNAVLDSFEYCYAFCLKTFIVEKCNCKNSLILHDEDDAHDNISFCFSLKKSQPELFETGTCFLNNDGTMVEECFNQCRHRCESVDYITESTASKWPLSFQYDSFYEKIIAPRLFASKFKPWFKNISSDEHDETRLIKEVYRRLLIEENFVNLRLELDFNVYLEYIEVPMYSITALVGTLGGGLNLWTGITVLFFIEIIEVIINIFKRLCTKNNSNNTRKIRKITVGLQTF